MLVQIKLKPITYKESSFVDKEGKTIEYIKIVFVTLESDVLEINTKDKSILEKIAKIDDFEVFNIKLTKTPYNTFKASL